MKPYEIRSVILGFALILLSSEDSSFLALIGFIFIIGGVIPKSEKKWFRWIWLFRFVNASD